MLVWLKRSLLGNSDALQGTSWPKHLYQRLILLHVWATVTSFYLLLYNISTLDLTFIDCKRFDLQPAKSIEQVHAWLELADIVAVLDSVPMHPPLKAYIACSYIVLLLRIWNVHHVISGIQQVKRAIAPNLGNIGQGGWCSVNRLLPCMALCPGWTIISLTQEASVAASKTAWSCRICWTYTKCCNKHVDALSARPVSHRHDSHNI